MVGDYLFHLYKCPGGGLEYDYERPGIAAVGCRANDSAEVVSGLLKILPPEASGDIKVGFSRGILPVRDHGRTQNGYTRLGETELPILLETLAQQRPDLNFYMFR
ncbi:hypothetical protein ACFL0W_03115 [Nanoarchaeota archaeon]